MRYFSWHAAFGITISVILLACSGQAPRSQSGENSLPAPSQLASGLIRWEGWEAERHVWFCEGQSEPLQVYSLREQDGEPEFLFLHASGVSSVMRPWPAASGMRFISFDEQQSYRWHEKGDEARLSFLAADDMAWEDPVLTNCRRWRRDE